MSNFLNISVQDFFTITNWNNAPPKIIKSEIIINWRSQSVASFFHLINWSGIDEQEDIKEVKNVIKKVALVSVQEFFEFCNWRGKELVNKTSNVRTELKLTLSVTNFFSQFNWNNVGKKDNIPEKNDYLTLAIEPDFQLSLDDLSNLF